MFSPTRDEARKFLFESWRKRRAGELLTPLEDLTAQLIDKHPNIMRCSTIRNATRTRTTRRMAT